MKKGFTLLLMLVFLISGLGIQPTEVNAAGNTLREKGIEVNDNEFEAFPFSTSTIQTDLGPWQDESTRTDSPEGVTYTATYPNSLDYYGKKLTVEVKGTLNRINDPTDTRFSGNAISNRNNRMTINTHYTGTNDVTNANKCMSDWTVTITLKEGNAVYNDFVGLIGFRDPDGSNILFNTSGKKIYYRNALRQGNAEGPLANANMADGMLVQDNGIFINLDYNDNRARNSVTGYSEGFIFVEMNHQGSLTLQLQGYADEIGFPYIYKLTKEYKITYTMNGGANNSANPSKYTSGSTINIKDPTPPTGYKFTGWTEGNKINPWESGDKHFTANFTKESYPITYTLNGGTNNSSNPSSYQVDTNTITIQNPTRTGYTFNGWTGSNGSTPAQKPTIPKGSTGEKNYVASWTPIDYNITYTLNGGTNDPANPSKYNADTPTITIQNPTRDGYTFLGWTGSNGTTPGENPTIPQGSTGDKTYTANWEATPYLITYVLNGGTNHADNPSQYTIESPTITIQDPTRPGYRFLGWEEGDTIPTGSTGEKVFTARWEAIEYPITYETNGGTNHEENPSTYTVETPTITFQDPTKEGYEFLGWHGSNGDDPETKPTLPTGSTGEKHYIATWRALPQVGRMDYVDEEGNSLLDSIDLEGVSDAPFPDGLDDNVQSGEDLLISRGYERISNNYQNDGFDNDVDEDQIYTAVFKPIIEPITADSSKTPNDRMNPDGTPYPEGLSQQDLRQKKVRTIEYLYADGTPVLDENGEPKVVQQEIVWERTATVNHVTGEIVYGNWKAAPKNYHDEVNTPSIADYVHSRNQVEKLVTTVAAEDLVEEKVFYAPLSDPTKRVLNADKKDADGKFMAVGDTIFYEIVVHNTANWERDFHIEDPLPMAIGFVSASHNGGLEGNSVVWDISAKPNETLRLQVQGTITEKAARTILKNRAVVTVDDKTTTTNEVTTPVPEMPVKTVTDLYDNEIDGELVAQGGILRYAISLQNPSKENKTFVVSDTIPANMNFLRGSDNVTRDVNKLVWNLTLKAGERKAVSFEVEVTGQGVVYKNTASVAVDDIVLTTNTTKNQSTVAPKKAVKDAKNTDINNKEIELTDTLVYEITVTNPSAEEAKYRLEDRLFSGVEFIKATDNPSYDKTTKTLVWDLTLAANETKVITVEVKPDKQRAANATIRNTAKLTPVYTDGKLSPFSLYSNEVVNPIKRAVPNTGDTARTILWSLLAALSAGWIGFLVWTKKKKH